ncbi:MAG: YceI family protein [Dehalococcoidia bacterium]|jgi:polyisoprenoid-binding protein YceI|nr:YceI family protein [Dehalococcoidia bacterium]MDW8009055.1 YceI family protein [Chloroflexota bacterium]
MRRLALAVGAATLLAIAAAAAGVAFFLSRSDPVELVTEAPSLPTDTAAVTPTSDLLHFVVVPEQSEASYIAREKLASLPVTSEAVGRTNAISGDIYLTRQGLASSPPSVLRVDLRTLRSDETRRDNYVRNNTLQADRFPYAEFVLERVDGFPPDYREGEEVALRLSGTMTIRGTSRPMTFDARARYGGGTLTGVAHATFKLSDFGLSPPNIAGFVTVEDEMRLQIVLVARLQG